MQANSKHIMTTTTNTYNKMCELWEQLISRSALKETTRTLLVPILESMDLYEQDRASSIRQKLFTEICSKLQWYYWIEIEEENRRDGGQWREFPPLCTAQLNKAVKEKKTSLQVTFFEENVEVNYIVDFTKMTTRRLVKKGMISYIQKHASPIYSQAFNKEGFNINKYTQLLKKLNANSDQNYPYINGILKLIASSEIEPLETELACTALTFLLRLISHEGMAKDFIKINAIPTLLKIRCVKQTVKSGMTAPPINTLIALILRQCIDCEDDSLKQSFEGMISNTCHGSPVSMLEATSRKNQMVLKRYQKDPNRVFRLLTPLAAISPEIFLDAVKQSLIIKNGELQLNEQQRDPAKVTLKHENLNKVMHELVKELLSENADRKEKADECILNSASLLKLIAEILRSYPQASLIFVHINMSYKGDSALKQIIQNFLLNNADPKNAEMDAAAKAVLSCLMTGHATSKVTDQIVDDLKLLLCSVTEEYTNGNCNAATTIEKTKIGIKFADQMTIIARLLIVFNETVTHQTYSLYVPNDSKQTALALTKSVHKKNLLNDFIKTIWSLPLHERQGIEAVNTLLKLLEGIIGKYVSNLNLIQPDGNGTNEEGQHLDNGPPQIHDDSSAAENPDEDDEEEEDDDDEDDDGVVVLSIGSQSQHNSINDSTSQSDEDMVEAVDNADAEIDHNSERMEEVAVQIYSHPHFEDEEQVGIWPAFAWEGINSIDDLDRMTPYFLDRVADQCRVLDSNLPFHIGTVLVSYVCSVIEVLTDQPTQNTSSESDSNSSNNQQMRPMEEQTVAAPESVQTQTATSATNSDEQMAMTEQETATAVVAEIATTNMEETSSQQQPEVTLTSSTNTAAATEAPGQPTAGENTPNQVVQTQAAQVSSIDQQQQPVALAAQVPEGIDPAFLAALPEDMRQEVIRNHTLQQLVNAIPMEQPVEQHLPPERLATILGMQIPEGMDPAVLAALPEDIVQEVVREHQRQQEIVRQLQAQLARARQRHAQLQARSTARRIERQMITTLSDARAIQLLDQEAISTLLLLYFFYQKFNTTRLQKILRSVCVNPASCDFVIWSLMSMLHGLEKFVPVDNDGGGSQHSQIGWLNNLRMRSTLDKNERLLQITANTVNINPQIRSTATKHTVDTLCYLAQRFVNHFMPKNIRDGGKQQQQPPSNIVDHFWPTIRSINEKSTEDALRSLKLADLQEIIADKLEKSPFAFIVELTSSILAQQSQPFLDKLIRAALMLSQGLTSNIYEKATPETKQWVTQRLGYLINVLIMEKSTNESFMDGQVLIAKMLEIFPSECQQILGTLRHGITKNGTQLKEILSAYQDELAKMPSPKDDIQ